MKFKARTNYTLKDGTVFRFCGYKTNNIATIKINGEYMTCFTAKDYIIAGSKRISLKDCK